MIDHRDLQGGVKEDLNDKNKMIRNVSQSGHLVIG
jgi:hypothetical protein